MKKFNFYCYIFPFLSFMLNYYCLVECGGARGARYGGGLRPSYGTSGRNLGAFSPFVPIGRPNVEYIAIPIVKKVTHHHVHHFIPRRGAVKGAYARPIVGGYARPIAGGLAPALPALSYAASGGALAVSLPAPKFKPEILGVITPDKLCALTKGTAKVGGSVGRGVAVGGAVTANADAYGSSGGAQYSKRKGDIENKTREYVPSAETVKLFKYLEKLGY